MQEVIYTTQVHQHLLYYRVIGEGSPIVLLHGYGVSSHVWHYISPLLAQHHQLWMVDLPGYGRSKHYGVWELRAIAPLLLTWMQQVGLSSTVVMGHSMGGAIAIHLAASAPQVVNKLIIVDSAGLPFQSSLPRMALRTVRSALQSGGKYPRQLIRDMLQPRLRLLWSSAQEVVHSDFREEVALIQQPTLIIWGEQDPLIPLSFGQQLQQALPHAQFALLHHSGHRPMMNEPQRFSQIVLDFLAQDDAK